MTQEIENGRRGWLKARRPVIAAALLGVGLVGGAAAIGLTRPAIEMAPTTPVAITSLKDDGGVVTLKGKAVEVYGPMFVLQDGSGKALVEAGRHGDSTTVTLGSAVTVQGHYHDGVVRASFLVGPDGKVVAVGPMHGPGREHHGFRHEGRDGPPDGDRDEMGPPPPPPGAGSPAPVAPAPAGNGAG